MNNEEHHNRELNFYNRLYAQYIPFTKKNICSNNSVTDLDYAGRLLNKISRAFALPSELYNKRILDVGCGLGFMAEAFRRRGAEVTAMDFSEVAIKQVKAIFPYLNTVAGTFPDALAGQTGQFNIIFERDLTLLSTLDLDTLCSKFFIPALELLTEDGLLICGSRSNFSGRVDGGNWANWSYGFIKALKKRFSLQGPKIVNYNLTANPWLAYLCRKSELKVPFYFILTKQDNQNAGC